MKLLIRNGTLVTGAGLEAADVLCDGGVIAAITQPGRPAGQVDEVVDARGLLVFPGFIDPHVHSRDPGQREKEDFAHSTAAAACSGLTTILEMPNAIPPVTDAATFQTRAAEHAAVASVDFGLWALSLGHENLGELAGLFEAGAVGVKVFWGYALDRTKKQLVYNAADLPADQVIPPPDLGAVIAVLEEAARSDGLVAAHCEDPQVLAHARLRTGAITTYDDLLASRPAHAESAAVAAAIEAGDLTGARFHVLHVACARTVELVRRARRDGVRITAETCPHYLFLTQDDAPTKPGMKVYPPIRSKADRSALWEGVRDGTITSLSSDHAPHAPQDKERPLGDQPAGMHGVETMVPLVLDAMSRGVLDPRQVARVLAENTAELYGIAHRKGGILVGRDADLTLVDPDRPFTIDETALHTRHPRSVFHGHQGHGVAVASILRGRPLMRDGELVPGRHTGSLIRSRPTGTLDESPQTTGARS
jgi:dihydroorotase